MESLVIVGAGGHGRETLDVIEAINAAHGHARPFHVLGFVADHADRELLARRGALHLGGVDDLVDGRLDQVPSTAFYVVAIGDPTSRRALVARLESTAMRPALALVHPAATLGADVRLGVGSVVAAGARITTNVEIGRFVQVNVNAVVSHDCRVGDHVTLSPGVLVNGSVTLGEGAFLGTASVVTPGRTVGAWAVVGAGAIVVGDVPAGVTAVGVPARWT
jgi:sugar O-acyltransferase (sialic acid O-acetyltransferase NeuD family)